MNSSDWIATASLIIALAALALSAYAIIRANKTTSAATLVTLNEGFSQAWVRFLQANAAAQAYELAELLNLLEIACAIYLEGSLSGNSRKLMFEYLDGSLTILVKNQCASKDIPSLLQSETTFIFIKKFLNKKATALSETVPPKWYESRVPHSSRFLA
ncbi:MAG: hypothetical protein ACYCOR_08650 [Acidobacteriaceae bacterium]